MLINESWQPVAATDGIEIYPFIRKPNFSCSNSFVLSTDQWIILIDPGADAGQMSKIRQTVSQALAARPRPVLVLLTHCHVDHWVAAFADPLFRQLGEVRIAAHQQGAAYIMDKNKVMTMSDLAGLPLPDAIVDLPLFASQPGPPHRLALAIGSRDIALIDPMPGHSPDSICIQIGNLLFAGDFFFALDYLIAGLNGWDRDAMGQSIERMQELARQDQIGLFCTGHGNPFPAADARLILQKMQRQITRMPVLPELNMQHIRTSAAYAVEMMNELHDTMAVMTGRLYALSYYLEMLGEEVRSAKYTAQLDTAALDDLVQTYQEFAERYTTGDLIDFHLLKKVGQIIAKMERLLSGQQGESIIDARLLQRLSWTFGDFIKATGGMPLEVIGEDTDLDSLVADLLQSLQRKADPGQMMAALDSETQFVDGLVNRLADATLFRKVKLDFKAAGRLPAVNLHRARFRDALSGLLEEIAALDTRRIELQTRIADGTPAAVWLTVSSPDGMDEAALNARKWPMYQRKFALQGISLTLEQGQNGQVIHLALPVS